MKSFLLAVVLSMASLVPRPTAAAPGNTNPNPIRIIFDLHADPRPELTGAFGAMTYSNWVEASNWLLDQTEPRGAKVSFLSVGQFMEWVLARPATGYPLMRRLYASGGQIGTHSHDDSRASSFNWTNLPAHPDSAAITKFWEDHLNLVDEVIRRALGVTDPAAIRAINFVRGSWLPGDDGERLALMALSGYTQHEQGPDEEFYKYFEHYPMNPYRPLGDLFLQHDPAGAVIVAPIGSVLGSTEHMGFAQDNRVPAIQARFLLEVLNWLHDRHVAGTGKIWCEGWGSHCHDMLPGGTSRDFVVPLLDWLNEHFINKAVGGSVCASYASMGEVGDAYRAWETAHPGETSFSYPATTTDWSLYPYLRPAAEYLAAADYVSNMPPVGTVRWHKVTIDPEGALPYTGYVAYSTNGVPVTVNLSASLTTPTIAAVDTVTGAATIVPRTAVPVPAKGVILVPAALVSRPDLRLTIAASPNPVIATSNFTWSVTVTNKGGGVANGIVFSNSPTAGLSFVSATSSQGSCSNSSSGVRCSLGTLQPGGTLTVSVVGIPDFDQLATALNLPEMQETISASNSMSVVATETDANPLDNTAAALVLVLPLRDFGDAPVPAYPTLLPNGARHRIGALRFGVLIDAEPNGQPVDLDGADEIPDGIFIPAGGFVAGGWNILNIMVSGPAGYIDLWIDLDGVPGWGAADHVLIAAYHPGGGAIMPFGFAVPPGPALGMTWGRARVGKNPAGLPTTGYGGFGEVVDFHVVIGGGDGHDNPVNFAGLQHTALGGAQLSVASNLLSITTAGGTGGVKVKLGDSDGYAAYLQGFDHLEATNSTVQFSAYGSSVASTNTDLSPGWLTSIGLEGNGSNATLSVDFSGLGATQYQAFFYNGNAQLVGTRTVAPPPGPSPAPFRLFTCPEGTLRIVTIRFINGRWILYFDCIRLIDPDLLELADVRVLELVPKVDTTHFFIQEFNYGRLPGPVLINDAVYFGGLLYTAIGSSLLDISNDILKGAAPGSNSTGGLVMHSGVSELAPAGTVSALLDEEILDTYRMRVQGPTAPQISNRMLRSRIFLQPEDSTQVHQLQAEITAISQNVARVTTDFSALGAAQLVAEVYQGSNRVGRVTVPSGNVGTLTGSNSIVEVSTVPSGPYGFTFGFAGPVTFNAASGPSYTGNELRLAVPRTGDPTDYLKGLEVEAAGEAEAWNLRADAEDARKKDRGDAWSEEGRTYQARHRNGDGLRIGQLWDGELNPKNSTDCLGDDEHNRDDEDGVENGSGGETFGWSTGDPATVTVTLNGTRDQGYVGIWVDWDNSHTFDADEFMAGGQYAVPGTHTFIFTVPEFDGMAPNDPVYCAMRVRVSNKVLAPGDAERYSYGGECEDYRVSFVNFEPIDTGLPLFAGLAHTALGNATVSVSSNGLQLANLGTNGTDGLRINLGRAEGWRGDVTSFQDWSDIIWSARGSIGVQSNQPLSSLRIERAGSNLTFSADFSGIGASQYVAEYYDQSGVHLSSTPPMAARQSIHILGCVCHIEVFADSIYILVCDCDFDIPGGGFPGGSPGGVLVKLSAVAPMARPDFVSAVEITGTGSLTLGSEALRQFGVWNRAIGDAQLHSQDNGAGLIVAVDTFDNGSFAGGEREGGIETVVGGSEYIGELPAGNLLRQRVVQFWYEDPFVRSASNSHVRWTVTGRVTGSVNGFETLSDLSIFKQEQGTAVSASFAALGAMQAQVDVFNGLVHVGSFTLPGLGKLNASTGGVTRVSAASTDGTVVWTVKWDTRSAFTPSNGVPLIGDRLCISAVNPTITVEGLRSLITRGANVESFALGGFNTATPQRPSLGAPRLLLDGRLQLSIPTEPDVTYEVEHSASVNGPWTPIGRVMGTDGTNTTLFEDATLRIDNSIRLFRIRIR